jgi:hypothetical protein
LHWIHPVIEWESRALPRSNQLVTEFELADWMAYRARVEAKEVHELVPRSHEVIYERTLRVHLLQMVFQA